jgi:SpoVK/Ycf46/Vps4 family AAA+-type ATPase
MIEFYQREEYETALAYLWIVIHKEEKNDAELLCTSKVNITDIKSTNPIKDINSTDDELDQLIGMNALKADVRNLVNFVKMQQTRKEKGLRTVPVSLHLVFTGNPGTGKTTVARILAKIYKQLGILSKGQLVEVDRSGLVAGYVGQTAIKTQEKIDEAKGGILFIDEAYTLVKDGNDYGQEAIDTILKAMEDNREDFIVIVAGYPDLMANFINSNPGLKSRFNKYFYFDDYSCDELEQIFNLMCQKYDYKLETSAEKAVREHIREMVANKDANFANARDIRNYFESIISNQASRVMLAADYDGDNMITITVQDVIL